MLLPQHSPFSLSNYPIPMFGSIKAPNPPKVRHLVIFIPCYDFPRFYHMIYIKKI